MKNRLIDAILILMMVMLFLVITKAQTVSVPQTFVDDATKAFSEVLAQRKVIEEFLKERAKTDAERANAQMLIKGFDELLAIKDRSISALEKLNKIYEQIIEFQNRMITMLENRLNKPKSTFQKILKTIKEIAIFAGGILIGRGSSF